MSIEERNKANYRIQEITLCCYTCEHYKYYDDALECRLFETEVHYMGICDHFKLEE